MGYTVEETVWIPLTDGTRLAARLWMPRGEGPFPAVLEYLPYRRRDGTSQRDASTYPAFAGAGIAGVRVDSRGKGDSEGHFDDEYSEQELSDVCEVIAWIAAQSWSNGRVGMMGISWGGFNALQVAARRPPALGAIISIASGADRYGEDIHYKGGCLLAANISWAATMHSYASRPPDPVVVGERWRDLWVERLRALPARDLARPSAARRLLAPRLGLRGLVGDRGAGLRHRRRGAPQNGCQMLSETPRPSSAFRRS